jgi:hypothetical protein
VPGLGLSKAQRPGEDSVFFFFFFFSAFRKSLSRDERASTRHSHMRDQAWGPGRGKGSAQGIVDGCMVERL